MIWGFAGPWYGPFLAAGGAYPSEPAAQLRAKLAFLRRCGLSCTGASLGQLAGLAEADRDAIFAELADGDLHLTLHVGFRYLTADADEIARQCERTADLLAAYAGPARCPLCTTGPHAGHRFDRSLPLEAKLDRLTTALTPLAEVVGAAGLKLGVENHGDYYVDDLVTLCRRVPGLGLFLDTGNCYLIGERPLPAFEVGAAWCVGTHFKDHLVAPRPEARPLHFEVGGAALGDGDVPLRACWDLLRERNPGWRELVMEIEMIAPEGGDPTAALERSLAFCRALPEGGPQ